MRVVLSGAAGFVGSHVLRHLLVNTDWEIVAPVSFRHKGLPARLASSVCGQPDWTSRVDIVHWDMRSPATADVLRAIGDAEAILNVASESHVDRSITEPVPFVRNNVDLMLNVLELARTIRPRLLLQMSTDEVYGPAYGTHRHKEWEAVIPSNPYSASKAAQEAIAISYWRTYGVPLVITNTMNIIGEMQDPEKYLPMVIRSLRDRQPINVHVSPEGRPGSRHYLHARNLADAWLWIVRDALADGGPYTYSANGAHQPERYHIVGDEEIHNDRLVFDVAMSMGLKWSHVQHLIKPVSFHASRPGHDLRYALDGSRLADLGWRAPVSYSQALDATVGWTLAHPEWLEL